MGEQYDGDMLDAEDYDAWEENEPGKQNNPSNFVKYNVDNSEDTATDDEVVEFEGEIVEVGDSHVLRLLLDFGVNNSNLAKLEAIINEFNPFKILAIEGYEIRHSNALAWLLDPYGHHGLTDTLFKNLLLEVLRESQNIKINGLPDIADIIGANFSDLQVHREWNNIDVFALSPMNKLVVVIENKIDAAEGENQLVKYAGIVDKHYPEFNKVFVFLTPDGARPKGSDRYIIFTHKKIYSIVQSAVSIKQDYMHTKVYDFIQQYLQILEERVMENEKIINICTRLYLEHKEAINMIMTYGKPTLPMSSIREFHSKTDTESIFDDGDNLKKRYHTFIPKAWSDFVPDTSPNPEKYYVAFDLLFKDYESYKIYMYLYISGNWNDSDERNRFVEILKAQDNPNGRLNLDKLKNKVATVLTKTITLENDNGKKFDLLDYETITAKIIKTYNSPDFQEGIAIVDKVVKEFWKKN